jgi:hypothetical protein
MKAKDQKVVGAAMIGFIAPLTVALASGVHAGDSSAGWFVAASWFFAIIFGVFAKLFESIGESLAD